MSPTLAPSHERLTRYLDGELDASACVEFEQELARDEALASEFARLQRLRSFVTDVPAAFSVPDPGDLAFERVRQNVFAALDTASVPGAETARTVPASNVVPIGSAKRSRSWLVVGSLAVAAAAAVAIFVVRPWEQTQVARRTPAPAPSRTAVAANHDDALNGTEIIRVEFGKMSGTYWEQAEGNDRVAVVWIDDTVLEEVGRQ